jgi:hypothetical protein
MNSTIIRSFSAFTFFIALFAQPLLALTDADAVALKELTKQYVSWTYSGRPVEFRQRLDYQSFEKQRQILLKLADIQWGGIWGDYWRRREVNDLKALRALSPKDFWMRFHSVVKADIEGRNEAETSVAVHAITEARGDAYVIYQARYPALNRENEDRIEVLRAHLSEGEWRLLAFPNVTADLRRQLQAAQSKK